MTILSNHRLYIAQVEKLHRKYLASGKLQVASQGGLSFSRISLRRRSFAKTLAKEVAADRYVFKPVVKRKIPKPGKPGKFRTIYLLEITDLVVHGVLAEFITDWVEQLLPDSTFSYRSTKTWWDGVSSFAAYVRGHVAERPSPKDRGLHVLRSDVKEYFASIPIGQHSKLWPMLDRLIKANCPDEQSAAQFRNLLSQALRPAVREEGSGLFCEMEGIPTGSPLSPSVSNLYLNILDRSFTGVPGAFYARYGDDFLFAHPERPVVEKAEHDMENCIRDLDLKLNSDKAQRMFFSGSGAPPADDSNFQGSPLITFLGCDISFKGEITIRRKTVNSFVKTIRRRVRKLERVIRDDKLENKGQILCRMVNRILDPNSPFKHPYIEFLNSGVTSRPELKGIDFSIALTIAEALTGINGVKAFRSVPYKTMRRDWGLISLVAARNAK